MTAKIHSQRSTVKSTAPAKRKPAKPTEKPAGNELFTLRALRAIALARISGLYSDFHDSCRRGDEQGAEIFCDLLRGYLREFHRTDEATLALGGPDIEADRLCFVETGCDPDRAALAYIERDATARRLVSDSMDSAEAAA